MSVDSGAGVAVMSEQKMSATKMGHAPCHKTNGEIEARDKHDKNKRRTTPQPSRMFDASLAHYSMIRIA
jgi:hypothetical protein